MEENLNEVEYFSKKNAIQLFDQHQLESLEVGKFSTLQFIHHYLFEDIYDFAGQIRTVNIANVIFDLHLFFI